MSSLKLTPDLVFNAIVALTATPARLRDNSWGARVEGSPSCGDEIIVHARNGKTWGAIVDSIVWAGADRDTGERVALVRTRPLPAAPKGRKAKVSTSTHWTQQPPTAQQQARNAATKRSTYDPAGTAGVDFPCPDCGARRVLGCFDSCPRKRSYQPAEGEVCRTSGCLGAPDRDGLCPRCADLRNTVDEFNAIIPPRHVELEGAHTLKQEFGGDPWADEDHPLHERVTGDDEGPECVWADDDFASTPVAVGEGW